jgi:transcription elongation factor GreB
MSKAFTKDESEAVLTDVVTPRAPLPSGTPNYVTPRGLELLRSELAGLEAERAALGLADDAARRTAARLAARIAELEGRIATAVPIDPATHAQDRVRFGATVRVRGADGAERRFQIVGVDEADPQQGRIAFVAPLARALLGQSVGAEVTFQSPRGIEQLEVLEIVYAEASEARSEA